MTPSDQLYIPVLPYKSKKGKLTFPLCRECVENQITTCTHFGERCRNLIGTWTTVELQLALNEGYKIINVYEIAHFKNSDEFIRCMLKGKIVLQVTLKH